jgi:hypothetical protein
VFRNNHHRKYSPLKTLHKSSFKSKQSATLFMCSKIHKITKNVTFCHTLHDTVTFGSSKAIQLFVLKLRRFWHHCELCSIIEKWLNRANTNTHIRLPFFICCFIVFRDFDNVQKNIKNEGINFLFLA